VLRGLDPESERYQVYDSFVYCLPLELKKVLNTELLDLSVARQPEAIRTRVENSHGILKDCFQQSMVQLAQVFDASITGQSIFPDFSEKRQQAVALRDGLGTLIEAVKAFEEEKTQAAGERMREAISAFYDKHMYRDWSGFELFFIEILKCPTPSSLHHIAHRFGTFLTTLHREVQKRAILQQAVSDSAAPTT
jgi:hypothetical protein